MKPKKNEAMGRYMTVVLKSEHINDMFIHLLNQELTERYGSNTGIKFNTWEYLQEEADYINHTPEGKTELPGWKRPITKETLHRIIFWLRVGEFSYKLSGGGTTDEARNAIAVCKWILKTNAKYIDKGSSMNYEEGIVKQYLDYQFEEDGYDLKALWSLP